MCFGLLSHHQALIKRTKKTAYFCDFCSIKVKVMNIKTWMVIRFWECSDVTVSHGII